MKEFIKVLEENNISYDVFGSGVSVTGSQTDNVWLDHIERIPENVVFTDDLHDVYLNKVKSLPASTIFRNTDDINLESLETLPEGYKFEAGWTIDLGTVKKLPQGIVFKNRGSTYLPSLKELPSDTVFDTHNDIHLDSLEVLPEGYKFKNVEGVNLMNLQELPDYVLFANDGNVWLNNLKELNDTVWFKNKGDVFLSSLKTLPEFVDFHNTGLIMLPGINGPVQYNGQTLYLFNIDGITFATEKPFEGGILETHEAFKFAGGKMWYMEKGYITYYNGFYGYARKRYHSVITARCKYAAATSSVERVVRAIKYMGTVNLVQFKFLTGATVGYVERLFDKNKPAWRKLGYVTLDEAMQIAKDDYYGNDFLKKLCD